MLKLGLTGGMACGKSTVGEMLRRRGALVLDADRLAHELMRPGQPCYGEILQRFGSGILSADKSIDRARLAAIVFDVEQPRIAELNAILHPAVLEHQRQWLAQTAAKQPDGVAVVEAALILEAGARAQFDKVVAVTCRPELKAERLAQRLGISAEQAAQEIARRSAAQWSDERKAAASDYVIDNSGRVEDTEQRVGQLWARLNTANSAPR